MGCCVCEATLVTFDHALLNVYNCLNYTYILVTIKKLLLLMVT